MEVSKHMEDITQHIMSMLHEFMGVTLQNDSSIIRVILPVHLFKTEPNSPQLTDIYIYL